MVRSAFAGSDTTNRKRQGFLAVDERGRCSLARVRELAHDRYQVDELPDGTLILTPAVIVSVSDWQRAQARPRGPGGFNGS